MIITSRNNEKIKNVTRLRESAAYRSKTGLYIVEGPRMVSEIPLQDIEEVYVSQSFLRKQNVDLRIESEKIIETQDIVFEKISDTKTPQGILAVVRAAAYSLNDLMSGGPILILEGIQDPGNLGTMYRSGEAAGIGGIICDSSTVSPYNPKVIRSTMGAIFRVPFILSNDLSADISAVRAAGYKVYAAHLKGSVNYTEPAYGKSAFLIGNEGAGLSDEISALADQNIRIPMEGQVESLNAAVSASILMYEWHRQNF